MMERQVGPHLFCALLLTAGLATAGLASEVVDEQIDRRSEGAAAAGFVLFSWQAPGEGDAPHVLIASGQDAAGDNFIFGIDKATGTRVGAVPISGTSRYGMSGWVHEGRQYVLVQLSGGLGAYALPD